MEYNPYLIAGIIIYIIYSVWITRKIINSDYLNNKQKTINSLFTWLVPFLWGLLVKGIITPSNMGTMTKSKRKIKKDKTYDNWQSLTGFGGGGGFA